MKAPVFLCLLLFASPAANAEAADVTGRWKVTISLGGETITGVALLTQTGDRVTGSIGPDERNQHPLDGVVKGNHRHPHDASTARTNRGVRQVLPDRGWREDDGHDRTKGIQRQGHDRARQTEAVNSRTEGHRDRCPPAVASAPPTS